MRAVVQRVSAASVAVEGEVVGRIGAGLCVLVGVGVDDVAPTAARMADKIWGLRILADADGRMSVSPAEAGAPILLISQFTLYGDTRRGRRPSWKEAASPDRAEPLVELVAAQLAERGAHVETGVFGADMAVELVNDGPVTLVIDL